VCVVYIKSVKVWRDFFLCVASHLSLSKQAARASKKPSPGEIIMLMSSEQGKNGKIGSFMI